MDWRGGCSSPRNQIRQSVGITKVAVDVSILHVGETMLMIDQEWGFSMFAQEHYRLKSEKRGHRLSGDSRLGRAIRGEIAITRGKFK